ncbi:MAG: universal stress protein [Alphaproteobacteria bacterium]|nr:universal stress protein [Alphaproteobacteria bacterium]
MTGPTGKRKFLIVVDDTPECHKALRFAWRRAKHTGGAVTLLRVTPTADSEWMAVKEKMREEAQAEAEELLRNLAALVNQESGMLPELVVREGDSRDVVLKLIDEDRDIRVLVLGASSSDEGPGPLVSYIAGKISGSMHIPVTIVPGSLTDVQIDELT